MIGPWLLALACSSRSGPPDRTPADADDSGAEVTDSVSESGNGGLDTGRPDTDTGTEHIYEGTPSANSAQVTWSDVDMAVDAAWAPPGPCRDIDGDGQLDVVLAGFGESRLNVASTLDQGLVTATATATGILGSAMYSELFGQASADATGDAAADLVVSDWAFGEVEDPAGSVHVFAGPVVGEQTLENSSWAVHAPGGGLGFGGSVTAADRDGDGVDEVYTFSLSDHTVYGFDARGVERVTPDEAALSIDGGEDGAYQVISAGDLTGDGEPDLLVAGTAGTDYVLSVVSVYGSGTLSAVSTATVDAVWVLPERGDATCDVDGDGVADLVESYSDLSGPQALGIWSGPLAGTLSISDASWSAFASAGESAPLGARCAGDQNLDGETDLFVDVGGTETVNGDVGALLLLLGPLDGIGVIDGPRVFGSVDEEYFGQGPTLLPDLDGDGAGEVAAGALQPAGGGGRVDLLLSSTWISGEDVE